jgi:phosphomevalonate kinase
VTEIRIPGKAVLSGEYTVLYGGVAVAVPVPRYLIVRPATAPPPGGYPLAAQAAFAVEVPELKRYEAQPPVIKPCEFDARELRGSGSDGTEIKLGLGSSAAEAVAALAWRFEVCGLDWYEHRLSIAGRALTAHSYLQHGLGSGIDVLVSAYCEALTLQLDAGKRSIRRVLPADAAKFPPLALAHTGIPANTRLLVSKFADWYGQSGKPGALLVNAACQAGDVLASAWDTGDWPALLDAVDGFDAKLRLCLDAAGVPYMLPRHHELAEWARSRGGRAKPSGAGGGDMALLIGDLPYADLGGQVIRLN